MFCPGCGIKEDQPVQFCRSCGTSFRPPVDAVTSSAMSAREEIGRAMAEKIREFDSSKDLKRIAEDVLPELEKFLESPAERRLRRIRRGTMLAFIGIGATIGFYIAALAAKDGGLMVPGGAGFVTFLIGIAMIINGYLHTVPKETVSDKELAARFDVGSIGGTTSDLKLPAGEPQRPFSSVTEGTTTHLSEKQPIRR